MSVKKFKLFGIGLLLAALLFFPVLGSIAQTAASEDMKKAVDFAEGSKLYEDWFMDSFAVRTKELIRENFSTFIGFAQVIGGFMTLLFFALRSYQMMTGEKKWEILPLLRPFGLSMIIIYWVTFVDFISLPTEIMAKAMWDKQNAQMEVVNNLRLVRAEYQYHMVDQLLNTSAQVETAAAQSKTFLEDPLGSMGRSMKEAAAAVVQPLLELRLKLQVGIQLALSQLLEKLALILLRLGVYTVLTIQIIYAGILGMLGPISVALSILPMFRDSFSTWIARFISVNLYTTVSFVIMFIGGLLQQAALTAEIERYQEIVTQTGTLVSMEKLLYLTQGGFLSFGMVIIVFLITAICMMTVPTISTWIVSSSGATSAVSTMGRAAPMIVGGSGRAASSAVGKIVGLGK